MIFFQLAVVTMAAFSSFRPSFPFLTFLLLRPFDLGPWFTALLFFVILAGLLIFRTVAEPRISSKSAKSHEIHKNMRNPAKFAKNLTKYMSPQHIWKLSWLLGLFTCCKLANLPWNFVTAVSKQHLKTTRRSQIKTQAFLARVDRGHWGWECDSSLFYRLLALREECCVLWRITSYTLISPTKMTIYFGTVRSTNDNAWKTCKMSKVHAPSHGITNKPCTSSYYKSIVTTDLKNKL